MYEKSLSEFATNTYSQFGEDGIILEILSRLKKSISLTKWCVDVGAFNGVDLSNTCKLIREYSYHGVLIEGDSKQFPALKRNLYGENVDFIEDYVELEGPRSLDTLLAGTKIPKNFDLLSIDIDGMDFYVWESVRKFQPKTVCIEFNPTIPNAVEFVQKPSFRVKHGSSARSLVNLAKTKGYCLAASTESNLIFVENSIFHLVVDQKQELEILNAQGNSPQYIFSGYDGSILSNCEKIVLFWHFEFPISKIQILPRFLRKYRGDYGFFRKSLFLCFVLFSEPRKIFRRILSQSRSSLRN